MLYQRLAAHLIYAGPTLRADPQVIAANTPRPARALAHGISGDRPIVLVRLDEPEELTAGPRSCSTPTPISATRGSNSTSSCSTSSPALQRHAPRGDAGPRPVEPLGRPGRPAGRRLRPRRRRVSAERRRRCSGPRPGSSSSAAGARWRSSSTASSARTRSPRPWRPTRGRRGLERRRRRLAGRPGLRQRPRRVHARRPRVRHPRPADRARGRPAERAGPRPVPMPRLALPPAPWINVVANPTAGFLVSEAGSGYTWAGNSQANRLTPWSNDPVSDPPGEALYLRDEETGDVWSPTPLPVADPTPVARPPRPGLHDVRAPDPRPRPRADALRPARRPGEDRPPDADKSRRPAPPALGDVLRRVGPRHDPRRLAPFRSSPRSTPRPAPCSRGTPTTPISAAASPSLDVDRRPRTLTGDRGEFLGRNGSSADARGAGPGRAVRPRRRRRSTRARPSRRRSTSAAGESAEVVFLLGQGRDLDEARALARPLSRPRRRGEGPRRRPRPAGTPSSAPSR